ncbi:MAG: hypothetical protein IT385_01615 [Deltaproteobacteria bacterium]|nr:hypothetical protein [Deltaproteobacteria bacterium]
MTGLPESDVLDHLSSLAEQLRDAGEATLAMLEGAFPSDPSVLVSMASAAVIVRHERAVFAPDEPALVLSDRLFAALRGASGRDTLNAAIAELDLGSAIDLDRESDSAEQVSRLHDLFELGMLVGLVDDGAREAIVRVLDRNAALVLFERDAFIELYESANLLVQVIDLPEDHPVQRFLDTVIAATDALVESPSDAEVRAGFAAARAAAEARLPSWIGWREKLAALGEFVRDFFRGCARPLPAFAATGTVAWPAPRLVLAQRGANEEAALLASPGVLLLEWVGTDAPARAVGRPSGHILPHARGPLGAPASYWDLTGCESDTQIDFVADSESPMDSPYPTWSVPLTPHTTVAPASGAPPPGRLERWQTLAPGALAAFLAAQAERVRPTHRAWSRAFHEESARARRHTLELAIGRAWFPATVVDPDFEGVLGVVDSGKLFGREEREVSGSVRRWIGRLVDLEDHPALASINVQITPVVGVDFHGESYGLAAAVAALSRLLDVPAARAPVLSGQLGDKRAEVLPIASAEIKRRVAALEAPGAEVHIVDTPTDASPWLDELFGVDWPHRLRTALGHAARAHAREAVRAWQRFFQQRTVLSAAAERDRALSEAELALGAGLEAPARVQALWVRGAMRLHRGESALARVDLEAARNELARAPRHEHERWSLEECDAYLAIASVDSCRPSDAVSLLDADLARLDATSADHHDRRWHLVRLQVAGSLARALGAVGELDRAVGVARESLSRAPIRAERARSLMDLAELERRRGELTPARELLEEARAELDVIPDDATRSFTARFLRLYEVRAGVTEATYSIEPPDWDAWPQPAEVLEALLEGPEADLVTWLDTHIRPHLPTLDRVWLLLLLGALGRSRPRSTAIDAWLRALASALLGRGHLDEPTRAAAELTVARSEEGADLWSRRAPY